MERSERRVGCAPRLGDWIAAGAVAFAAVLLLLLPLLRPQTAVTVQIWQDGTLLYELPLDTDTTVTVGGAYENTIEIHGGAVFVSHATCPGGDCVRSGAIRATAMQYPDMVGEEIVRVIVRHLRGEPVPAETLIPTSLYR